MKQKELDEILKKVQSLPDSYWVERFREIEKLRQGMIEDLKTEFAFLFNETLSDIMNDVDTFFNKTIVDGEVHLELLSQTPLTPAEIKEIQAKVKVIEDDLNDLGLALSEDVKTQVENLNTKGSKLYGLQTLIKVRIDYLYTILADHITSHMEAVTNDSHDRTIYEVFKACGYGSKDLNALSDEETALILAYIWRTTEETFGDVVSRYGKTFTVELNSYLGRSCYFGADISDLDLYLTRRFNVKVSELNQMLVTDSTYFATQGQSKALGELHIEEAVFTAILDERTSDMCREADGTVIPVDKIVPWENAPPLHFNCRSTMYPVIEQVDFLTGKTYELDDNYDGWYEKNFL